VRAVVIREPGGPEVLELREVPTPEPGPGQVRVRVHAFGINRADLLQRRGLYPAPPDSPADIPGLEYAGEVDAAGDGVEGVAAGDRVMGIVGGGSYAEYVLTPASHVTPIPGGLSPVDAAAVPEVFITAHDALERLAVVQGEWVLVHAVGSGVGTAAVQLIRERGARCIGTSRTAAKLDRAKSLGMEAGVDTTTEELAATVQRITEGGAQAAIDLIGGSGFPATLDALAHRGRLILVGLTAGRRADVDLGVILRRRLRIEGTVLRSRSSDEKTQVVQSFRHAVLPLFDGGRIHPVVDRVFDFDEVADAHVYVESNVSFGKVVVRIRSAETARRDDEMAA
jgi:NADPH2:quinone reductase